MQQNTASNNQHHLFIACNFIIITKYEFLFS